MRFTEYASAPGSALQRVGGARHPGADAEEQHTRTEDLRAVYKTKAYSAAGATSPMAATSIPRRDPGEHDVQIEILFCGICHSDLHSVRNEWRSVMPTVFDMVSLKSE